MRVTKHSGITTEYDRGKLRLSLIRSGADEATIDNVIAELEQQLYNGIPTKKIFKIAAKLLKKISASQAARYNLRHALMLLGPAGFFFEKYVARIFEHDGYDTMVGVQLKGNCVTHEVDVVLQKQNNITMIECKFHSSHLNHTDVKVPMYILSRFNDLKSKSHLLFKGHHKIDHCMIATNNRFTSDAIAFANCSGLGMLSWDYPAASSLRSRIDRNKLYPLTCLTTLSTAEKEKLLIMDILLVKELLLKYECLSEIGISPARIKNIIKEAEQL